MAPSQVRYYVGFGTWIGPTILFAAPLVDMAFGIEADPVAFAGVETNVALNLPYHAWAKNVYLTPRAVRAGDSTDLETVSLEMKSSSAGNSCSGLGDEVHACGIRGRPLVSWKVNSNTLPSLLNLWQLPISQELFVKVDTESYECQLIPTWLKWLEPYSRRRDAFKGINGTSTGSASSESNHEVGQKLPTFFLAFHSQISKCSEEQYHAIYQFAQLFEDEPRASHKRCLNDQLQKWTCGYGEYLFRDGR